MEFRYSIRTSMIDELSNNDISIVLENTILRFFRKLNITNKDYLFIYSRVQTSFKNCHKLHPSKCMVLDHYDMK